MGTKIAFRRMTNTEQLNEESLSARAQYQEEIREAHGLDAAIEALTSGEFFRSAVCSGMSTYGERVSAGLVGVKRPPALFDVVEEDEREEDVVEDEGAGVLEFERVEDLVDAMEEDAA